MDVTQIALGFALLVMSSIMVAGQGAAISASVAYALAVVAIVTSALALSVGIARNHVAAEA